MRYIIRLVASSLENSNDREGQPPGWAEHPLRTGGSGAVLFLDVGRESVAARAELTPPLALAQSLAQTPGAGPRRGLPAVPPSSAMPPERGPPGTPGQPRTPPRPVPLRRIAPRPSGPGDSEPSPAGAVRAGAASYGASFTPA